MGDTLGAMLLPSGIGFVIEATSAQAMIWLVGGGFAATALAYVALRAIPRGAGSRT